MKILLNDDFPDRLSPMLVKELRQGLRTRAFIFIFLSLQITLGIILLGAGSTTTSDDAGSTISNIIFILFSIAVILIQPMRGMGALSSEIKGNTIDMMVLTRLSAWRIVAGKWSAIVSQSALMLITIIPYLILRYFFGGMNLVGEVMMLILIFITSAGLTAITVGLSASPSVILRSILPMVGIPLGTYIGLMFILFSGGMGGSRSIFDYFSLQTTESRVVISVYIAACIYYGFFMLSIGTTLIAPYADNYSTLRRIVSLVLTIAAAAIGMIYVDELEGMIAIYFIIFLPIFAISLNEFGTWVPPVVEKFHRYGGIGKLLGFFFLPGWATGVFYCYLITFIAAASLFFMPITYWSDDSLTIGMALISGMVFPAILVNLFKVDGPSKVTNYILITAASGIISLTLLAIAASLSTQGFLWLFVWLPPVSMVMLEPHGMNDVAVMAATIFFNIVYFVWFMFLAIKNYIKSMRGLKHSAS